MMTPPQPASTSKPRAIEADRSVTMEMETATCTAQESQTRIVDTASLFGPKDLVILSHAGEAYFLRRTRQGKLLLTK